MKRKEIPVVCYTSYAKAELFVNGKSYGIQTKKPINNHSYENNSIDKPASGGGNWDLFKAYSIVWDNVVYEPGEAKIVAYNKKGKQVAEVKRFTAGKPHHIKIQPELKSIKNGEVGVYIISVLDKNGNLCVNYNKNMHITITGAATFLAAGNGDPTNMQNLSKPKRKFFNGQAAVFIKSYKKGVISVDVKSDSLQNVDQSLIVE